jgi:23S rRNA pseudouridine1911/1915/1917 synthase
VTRDSDPQFDLLEFRVGPDEAGQRLDKLLAVHAPEHSRSYLKELAQHGHVRVGGEVCEPKIKLRAGQRVEAKLVPRHHLRPGGELELPALHVLFEDEEILVVNKPAGMPTHPGGGQHGGTLAQAAQAHVGRDLPSSGEPERGGIVHRLDRYTSGLLVLAKSEAALKGLQAQFHDREVQKLYLAIVHGEPRFESDWIEKRMERDPQKPERMRLVPRKALLEAERLGEDPPGRSAETYYELAQRLDGYSYLRCKPRTGRTHQIRVHLSSIDLPIVGEHLYKGRRHQGLELPEGAPPCDRHLLHAAKLSIRHPGSGEAMSFEAEMPADFAAVLEYLRARTGS